MSIARNSTYNLLGSVIPMAVGLITVPLYLSQVGIERFGMLAICWLMLGQLGFLSLGMGPALAQRLAASIDSPVWQRSALFWTAAWLNLAMGIVGSALVLAVAPAYFTTVDGLPPEVQREIGRAIPWLAGMVPLAMLTSILNGALQGRERFLAQNLIGAASSVLISALPLMAAFVIGPELDVLLPAAMAGRLLSLVLLFLVSYRAVPLMHPHYESALLKPLLVFGSWFTVISLVAPLVVTVDRFVIGALINAAAVSVYVVPYNLVERIKVLPQSLANALYPRLSYASAEDRDRLLIESVGVLSAVMTPTAVLAMAVIGPFMHLWVGEELAVQSNPIAYILLAGFWVNSFARVPWTLLQAQGRPDIAAKVLLAYLLPYAVLLYLCLALFGVVGAAIAWSIKALFDPIILFNIVSRGRAVLPILLGPGLTVCASMAVSLALPLDSAPRWALLSLLLLLACYIGYRTAPAMVSTRLNLLFELVRLRGH